MYSNQDIRKGLTAVTVDGEKFSATDLDYYYATVLNQYSAYFSYLGVDARTAAEDACRMEHVLSADTFEAIKRHITQGHELPENM